MVPGNINLTQLQTFLWVSSLRSFRKTAEKMNTTQPAISSRIARLEETLGVRLFERDTGFIHLTAKGLELLPYAEKLLRTSAMLVDRISQNEDYVGILRLGVSEAIVHTFLPDFLTGLRQKFPEIEVDIVVDATANLRRELIERSIDFALLMGPVTDYQIENHDLIEFDVIWAAAPSLKIDTDSELSLDELATTPLITYARNTRPYADLSRQLRKNMELPARIYSSSSLAAIHRMALDGVGIAHLPRQMIQADIVNGRLKQVQCVWHPPSLKFTASYPTEPYSPVTEKIVQHALEVAREYRKQIETLVPLTVQ
ncbi:LysR family transcriptional regulator [uncultured Sneathiella sp.]|uniref:LysR family transcriptional regulator n=1 Tax=uncultured Sneathiella sp. TaxID=879315 RepID=UPI0030EC05DB|tara:strand:+ start:39321 stop:40259 length:939 start_codon:yes stop_codon:yes gene_type:complete